MLPVMYSAQIVDAVGMVGVLMGIKHAIEPVDIGVEQLLAQIGRRVDEHARAPSDRSSTSSEQRRRRLRGSVGSQRPSRAGAGTPPDEPQPRIGDGEAHAAPPRARGTFANRRKKLSLVWRAICVQAHPAHFGQHLGGLDDVGRLVALAAIRPGAR